jgi:hypothetical protein
MGTRMIGAATGRQHGSTLYVGAGLQSWRWVEAPDSKSALFYLAFSPVHFPGRVFRMRVLGFGTIADVVFSLTDVLGILAA